MNNNDSNNEYLYNLTAVHVIYLIELSWTLV